MQKRTEDAEISMRWHVIIGLIDSWRREGVPLLTAASDAKPHASV